MEVYFRILQEVDAPMYRNFKLFGFRESPFAFSESYEDELEKDISEFEKELCVEGNPPEHFTLGAFNAKDELIGQARFVRDKRTKARHKSMIKTMYVHPDYRKQQVGKKLLLKIFEKTKPLEGLEQIHIWVLHAKDSAAKFYESCGFLSQGTKVKGDLKIGDVYIDAEYMVKYLDR